MDIGSYMISGDTYEMTKESFFKEDHDGSVYELLCNMTGDKDITIDNLPEDNKGAEAYYIYIKKIVVKITTIFFI